MQEFSIQANFDMIQSWMLCMKLISSAAKYSCPVTITITQREMGRKRKESTWIPPWSLRGIHQEVILVGPCSFTFFLPILYTSEGSTEELVSWSTEDLKVVHSSEPQTPLSRLEPWFPLCKDQKIITRLQALWFLTANVADPFHGFEDLTPC